MAAVSAVRIQILRNEQEELQIRERLLAIHNARTQLRVREKAASEQADQARRSFMTAVQGVGAAAQVS